MQFDVIYADPPWEYKMGKRTGSSYVPYPVMSLDKICGLAVQNIAADDAVLFLWTTTGMLEKALTVMKAWGFQYKTILTWVKTKGGRGLFLGYWFRGGTEHVLFGIRGKVARFASKGRCHELAYIITPVSHLSHGEKPEEMRQLIEKASLPHWRKAELFARKKVPGWSAWGLEVENDFEMGGNREET